MRFMLHVSSIVVVAGLCLSIADTQANTLKPFTTDGCSMWMDGTPAQPSLWRHCCVAHDKAYWLGGSEAQRKIADDRIQACVREAQGPAMADYMHTHIRWGGSPYWFSMYRWGYGWNYWENWRPRGYKTPTPEEQAQIDRLMPAAEALIVEDARIHAPKVPPTSSPEASNDKSSAASSAASDN